ncbi:MAG: hypothetical protein ABI240_17820 [Sphingomonas sp.]
MSMVDASVGGESILRSGHRAPRFMGAISMGTIVRPMIRIDRSIGRGALLPRNYWSKFQDKINIML